MKNWVAFIADLKCSHWYTIWDNCMILKFPSMSAEVSQYTGQDSHSNPGTTVESYLLKSPQSDVDK